MDELRAFSFQHPCTVLICGATGCGKTHFLFRVLVHKSDLFNERIDEIIYCYGMWQERFQKFHESIHFHEGILDVKDLPNDGKNRIVIFDDLMHEISEEISKSFTKYSHHKNITVIFITQNIFHKNRFMRDVTLNSHYLVLFQQKRDRSQVMHLTRQINPGESRELVKIYNECVEPLFGYMVLDFHPKTRKRFLVYTKIFPDEIQSVYFPSDV